MTKINTAYQEYWYPNVAIEWSAIVDRELGIVDLLIEIDEAQKIGIKKIRFSGNHLIESDQLRPLLTQKEKSFSALLMIKDAMRRSGKRWIDLRFKTTTWTAAF